jgi:hypothetical protein
VQGTFVRRQVVQRGTAAPEQARGVQPRPRSRPHVSIPELERLLDRWAGDPAFRDAVRRDPEGAITAAGFQLDDIEWATLAATDWTLSDEQLRARMTNLPGSPPA